MSMNPYESPPAVAAGPTEQPKPIWDEISVEFELTVDDLLAFNVHQISTSKVHKQARVRALVIRLCLFQLINALLLLLASLSGRLTHERVVFHLVLAVTIAIVIAPFIFFALRKNSVSWQLKRAVRKILSQGDMENMLGRRRFTVTSDYVEEWFPLRESRWKLACIQRIAVTPQHAFLYVSPIQALVVPVRAFTSPDHFATFIANLEGHTQKVAERSGFPRR